MLKTGRKCDWNEIDIGEIFAWNGCWMIFQKINSSSVIPLAKDRSWLWEKQPMGKTFDFKTESSWSKIEWYFDDELYKLPKSIQKLWKEE